LTYIRDNRAAIDRIVESLCEKETLTGDEFRELLSKYVKIPEENMRAANMLKQKTVSGIRFLVVHGCVTARAHAFAGVCQKCVAALMPPRS
jgi:2-iminoacetate synthase ThiH